MSQFLIGLIVFRVNMLQFVQGVPSLLLKRQRNSVAVLKQGDILQSNM